MMYHAHTMYENQKEDPIDIILELLIDSIPTVISYPPSFRSYFFRVLGIWTDREGQYEQRRGREQNRLINLSILIRVYPYLHIDTYLSISMQCIHIHLSLLSRWIWIHCWHLARNQIWTGGTRIFSPLLYQLSYPGSFLWIILVQGFNLCQLKIRKKWIFHSF